MNYLILTLCLSTCIINANAQDSTLFILQKSTKPFYDSNIVSINNYELNKIKSKDCDTGFIFITDSYNWIKSLIVVKQGNKQKALFLLFNNDEKKYTRVEINTSEINIPNIMDIHNYFSDDQLYVYHDSLYYLYSSSNRYYCHFTFDFENSMEKENIGVFNFILQEKNNGLFDNINMYVSQMFRYFVSNSKASNKPKFIKSYQVRKFSPQALHIP